jgi:ABC-type nickel/cobalt efflux system permease component RcnA
MISLPSIIALGFFLGMRHATDPDHVIAVTTIAAHHRTIKDASLIGALWGVGHTLTIIAFGGAIVLLGCAIPARIGLSAEFSVALMLILLGIINLTGFLKWINGRFSSARRGQIEPQSHSHIHADYLHLYRRTHHPESHGRGRKDTPLTWFGRHFERIGLYQFARPLAIGIVHGLAGSAAIALLVLATIRDPRWAAVYLCIPKIPSSGFPSNVTLLLPGENFVGIFAFASATKSWVRRSRQLRNPYEEQVIRNSNRL